MMKLRAGVAVAVVAAVQAFALVVSAPAQAAWSPPVSPDSPPRVTAPAPTTFKPTTTAVTPQNILKRAPIGLALALDPIVTGWLQSITGNSANPILGCTSADGKFIKNTAGACDSSAGEKTQTPGPNGLVVPDLLWGAMTGKNLNPLLEGPAPDNWSVSQFKPVFAAPSNGKQNFASVAWTAKQGALCSANPTWYSCPTGPESDIGWVGSSAKFVAQCKTGTGGITGIWSGYGNLAKGADLAMGGAQIAPKDVQFCANDQVLEYAKVKPAAAGWEYAPSIAPGVWVNPNKDLFQDTTITTTLNCKNAIGATSTVTGSTTGTGLAKQLQCPDGYLPDSGSTSVGNAFLDAPTKLDEWSILPETREQYNECIGWQSAGCIMRVELDGVDCTPGNPACFDWAEIQRLQPSRVKCKWGNYTIDISNCLPLRNGYQSEGGVSALPNQAPGTAPVSRDVFGQPVQPNADPLAPPQWQPDYGTPTNPAPPPAPAPDPNAPPITGTNPEAPPNPNPEIPPAPRPGDPEASGRSCFGTSWSWNPVDWVLHPVACALEWAFVPTPQVLNTKGGEINDKLRDLGINAPVEAIAASFAALPQGGSGCSGPALPFSLPGLSDTLYPFSACEGVMNTIANSVNAFGSLYLVVFGSISFVRAISAGFGFSFSMGKGGDS